MGISRLIIFLIVALSAVLTADGHTKPRPVDAESVMTEYHQIFKSDNQVEACDKWLSTLSDYERVEAQIVVAYDLLNAIDDDMLTDSIHYNSYLSAVDEIKKCADQIEKSDNHDGLYLKTSDANMIPVRYILANGYEKIGEYANADSAYTMAAQGVGRDFGLDTEEFVSWTNRCAEGLQRKNKNCEKAIRLLSAAKEAAMHSTEVSDSTASELLISLAEKYQRSGNHSEAKTLAHEAERRAGNKGRLIFRAGLMLGELYWAEGDEDRCTLFLKKAQENAKLTAELFALGMELANIMREKGLANDAETILAGLGECLNFGESTHADLFNYYELSGVLYTSINPERAEENFRKAESYIDDVGYPELIRHIINSQVYPNAGNSFKIISALDRAELIYNLFIGDEPRLLDELLVLKGYYLMDVRDYKTARKYLDAAYGRMLDYAPGDPMFLQTLKLLARLDEKEGDDLRREHYLDEQLRNAGLRGESSDAYLDAVADLLRFYFQAGNVKGVRHYLDIYRKNRPNTFETRCFEYQLKLSEGGVQEAEQMLDGLRRDFASEQAQVGLMFQRFYSRQRSPRICSVAYDVFANFKKELIRQLLFMSDNERRNVDAELREMRNEVVSAIRFAPDLTELALDYSLFTKGLLFHTQSEIRHLINDTAKVELAKINGLKADMMRAINVCDRKREHSLQREIESRERYMIDDYLDDERFAGRFDRYNASALRECITSADMMVDFVEYVDSGKTRVGGFIIEKTTPVRFIDFGEASELDMDNAGQRIWSNVFQNVSPGRHVYFSTDGILNTIPIEFAEGADGSPVCEKYDLHRVFHLSDIRQESGIGSRVEAIGVADHNSPAGQARAFDDVYRGNWNDLAGVETELYHIAESLNGSMEYHMTFNDDATEQYVKSLSGQPVTTLHISTHGFFRGEKELTRAFNDTADFDHNIARRLLSGNRTSVSGLVMRNGNLSWKAETIVEDEDNILTSEEVETLSFPKLKLTVLSACESGLGESSADGIGGLQRAFRVAGSASLICSLRRVADNGVADFMAEFYSQAAKGLTVHEAFYNTRKNLLLNDPMNKEAWSSFILIE